MAHNPWKLTAIAMALIAVTALVTGLVVASRSKSDDTIATIKPAAPDQARVGSVRPVTEAPAAPVPHAPRVPDQTVVKACNERAAVATGTRDKTTEVVKDGAVGALVGAAVGAAGGAIADGGKGAGKGAAIGGVVGAGAGALYGVNENRKHDTAYRDAYSSCLRARGYAG
ncbi:MAG TPA: hypothetical protein VGL14_17510 [Methylomirabilota bacterium]|jgi:hypothetical protein